MSSNSVSVMGCSEATGRSQPLQQGSTAYMCSGWIVVLQVAAE